MSEFARDRAPRRGPSRWLAGVLAGVLLGLAALAVAAPTAAPDRGPSPLRDPGIETGVTLGTWKTAHPIARDLGARVARVEFPIGTPAAKLRPTVDSLARLGVRMLPLAGFRGRLPSRDEAASLRGWAQEFGSGGTFWTSRAGTALPIRDIEFGNETSYSYQWADNSRAAVGDRAAVYAERAEIALDALEGTGVGLMVQGDDGMEGPTWVERMLSAAPALGSRASAWTVHPYGDRWAERLDALQRHTAAAGASGDVPVAITEWGLATANGKCLEHNYGWDRCMDFAEAGRLARRVITQMTQRLGGRLRYFIFYTAHDLDVVGSRDPEKYFGLLSARFTDAAPFVQFPDKGAYTEFAREMFRSSAGARAAGCPKRRSGAVAGARR